LEQLHQPWYYHSDRKYSIGASLFSHDRSNSSHCLHQVVKLQNTLTRKDFSQQHRHKPQHGKPTIPAFSLRRKTPTPLVEIDNKTMIVLKNIKFLIEGTIRNTIVHHSVMRLLWKLISELSDTTLLSLPDRDLVQTICVELKERVILTPEEDQSLYLYVHSKLLLIRDLGIAT
jgi:hypothetical protein